MAARHVPGCSGEILFAASYGGAVDDHVYTSTVQVSRAWLDGVKSMGKFLCPETKSNWIDFALDTAVVVADSREPTFTPEAFIRRYCYTEFVKLVGDYFKLDVVRGYLDRLFDSSKSHDVVDKGYTDFVDSMLSDVRFIVCTRLKDDITEEATEQTQGASSASRFSETLSVNEDTDIRRLMDWELERPDDYDSETVNRVLQEYGEEVSHTLREVPRNRNEMEHERQSVAASLLQNVDSSSSSNEAYHELPYAQIHGSDVETYMLDPEGKVIDSPNQSHNKFRRYMLRDIVTDQVSTYVPQFGQLVFTYHMNTHRRCYELVKLEQAVDQAQKSSSDVYVTLDLDHLEERLAMQGEEPRFVRDGTLHLASMPLDTGVVFRSANNLIMIFEEDEE